VATRADGTSASATTDLAAGARHAQLTIPLSESGTGTWQVDVEAASRNGRLEQRIEIAADASRLVGPAMAWRAMPSPRSPLTPLADARLTRGERLHVEWAIVSPADSHVARLLDRTGQPLGQPLPLASVAPDRQVVAIDLPIGSLSEGDYVIELVATGPDGSERRLLPFRVAR
jgi:hypothetical protein